MPPQAFSIRALPLEEGENAVLKPLWQSPEMKTDEDRYPSSLKSLQGAQFCRRPLATSVTSVSFSILYPLLLFDHFLIVFGIDF